MQLIDKINGTEILANRAIRDSAGNNIAKTYINHNILESELKKYDDLIPEAASKENQLVDKAYVDFNTEQIAAKYLARDAEGNPFLSYAEFTDPDVVFYYAGTSAEPTKNDYVLINGDESIPEEEWISDSPPITRYWYTGTTWSFQYIVNNAPLNASQMAAINSGITKDTVASISKLPLKELETLPTEVNEYIHDQSCIQFKPNDNVAMVILDEISKHPWPYSAKFQCKDNTIARELTQIPPVDNLTADIIGIDKSDPVTKKGALGGFIINVFCIGGANDDTSSPENPSWKKFCYLELQTTARNVKDINRFKWWCRLAWGKSERPQETEANMQLHWQKALDDGNFGFATLKIFKSKENIVQRILDDFKNQYKPYHAFYCSMSNTITSSLTKIPAELVGSFQLHVWTSEGDSGTVEANRWKGVYHFDLIGHNSDNKPIKFIGYLNYTGTAKPDTSINISWEKVTTETVTNIR